jgi:osmotically-inducible protein OsmY
MLRFLVPLILAIAFPVLADERFAASPAPLSSRAQDRLEREVRSRLVRLPYYGVFDYISFQVKGYDVTLDGSVTRPTLRHDAEAAVKRIEGVAHLTNHIEVLSLSPLDDRLRFGLYRAIYGQPALNRYALQPNAPIRIIVKNGNVTLEGVVLNDGDRDIAFIQANAVPGVFSVRNHLRTEK